MHLQYNEWQKIECVTVAIVELSRVRHLVSSLIVVVVSVKCEKVCLQYALTQEKF